ncbi:MAG: hypothetical protein ACFFG0_01220 [Candidatus Thorarchaeota archaeon]
MADLLTKICSKYGCDKSDKNHKYTPRYNALFEKIRLKKFNLLEFGFGQGKSVKMWMEYFPNANIVSVDTRKDLPNDKLIQKYAKGKRFHFLSSDQIDKKRVQKILRNYGSFYIIIDDASHKAEDQQFTMSFSFPYVEPGGWYIIEDLKCKRSHNKLFKVKADKTLRLLENYIINKKFNSKILSQNENLYLEKWIEKVSIYDKIAFIKRRGNKLWI